MEACATRTTAQHARRVFHSLIHSFTYTRAGEPSGYVGVRKCARERCVLACKRVLGVRGGALWSMWPHTFLAQGDTTAFSCEAQQSHTLNPRRQRPHRRMRPQAPSALHTSDLLPPFLPNRASYGSQSSAASCSLRELLPVGSPGMKSSSCEESEKTQNDIPPVRKPSHQTWFLTRSRCDENTGGNKPFLRLCKK